MRTKLRSRSQGRFHGNFQLQISYRSAGTVWELCDRRWIQVIVYSSVIVSSAIEIFVETIKEKQNAWYDSCEICHFSLMQVITNTKISIEGAG
jgi:hypothetical protein